jgi:hypothetical protein
MYFHFMLLGIIEAHEIMVFRTSDWNRLVGFEWTVNIILFSTNDLKPYLTYVRLLKMINEAPKSFLLQKPIPCTYHEY